MKAKILLVDDTPEVLLALAAMLQPLGGQISQTTSGREALKRVTDEQFDFMLLDANMPDVSGLDIARHLLAQTGVAYLPMMLMVESIGAMRGVSMQFGCGEIDVLMKPINPRELKQKVGAYLELLQQQQACERQAVAAAYFAKRMQEAALIVQKLRLDVLPNFNDAITAMLETINKLRAGIYGELPEQLSDILPTCEQHTQSMTDILRELSEKMMLPITTESVKRPAAAAPPIEPKAPSKPMAQKSRILVVEDNVVNAMTMIHSLKSYGYDVAHVANGLDAVRVAKEEHPSLILMDIQLPEMDGLEATRQIRADASLRTTPIIALSAVAMPGDKERGLEAGLDLYLTKPVRLKELAEIIAQYLNEPRQ